MNTLKPQPPNAKKPSRLQSKREKIGNTKELLTVVEEGKNDSGSNNNIVTFDICQHVTKKTKTKLPMHMKNTAYEKEEKRQIQQLHT